MTSLYGFQPSSVFFLYAKQRLYDQTYKFVWGPDLICGFCMQTSNLWTKIACLYVSYNSPVIPFMQNTVPSIRINSLYGSQSSSVVFAFKTATFGTE